MATPEKEANPAVALLQDQLAVALQKIADLQAAADGSKVAPAEPIGRKVYYSVVPFCNIQVMRGPGYCESVSFIAGMLDTVDPQVIAQLEQVVDKPGSGITSHSQENVSAEVQAMREDVRKAGDLAQTKAVAAGLSTA